jgi:multiple sugar transport system permease protein
MQLFDEVFFVTKGGPIGRTSVVVFYVYRLAFEQGLGGLPLAGYAAAIAFVLFIAILLLTLAQFALGRRVGDYTS